MSYSKSAVRIGIAWAACWIALGCAISANIQSKPCPRAAVWEDVDVPTPAYAQALVNTCGTGAHGLVCQRLDDLEKYCSQMRGE